MTKLEEWRIKKIGMLMVKAGELSLNEKNKQALFYKISSAIDFYGLYETGEKEIAKIVEEFSQICRGQ